MVGCRAGRAGDDARGNTAGAGKETARQFGRGGGRMDEGKCREKERGDEGLRKERRSDRATGERGAVGVDGFGWEKW